MLLGHHPDAQHAVQEDGVAAYEFVPTIELLVELLDEGTDLVQDAVGPVVLHPTDAAVAHGEGHAGHLVEQRVDVLPLAEGVHEHADGTSVHQQCAQRKQVGTDAGQLTSDGAHVLCADGGFNAAQLLDG